MRIFIDLDGVLNYFSTHALNHIGCPIGPTEEPAYPLAAGWDIVRAANLLLPGKRFTSHTFWPLITRDVWQGIPLREEAWELVARCQELVGVDNVCLLTANTSNPECAAGKVTWIHEKLHKSVHRRYLIGPQKQFCAQPDALLIDDADHNVDDFRKAGGHALLVPRPWNRDQASTETIFDRLDQFFYSGAPPAASKVLDPVPASAG